MTRLILPALLAIAATPAFAHPGHAPHGSFTTGFLHPLLGQDHLLAMIAVGLWAAALGGRTFWLLPAGFVGGMVLGFGAALAGIGLPMVEPMILGSVIVLGLVVALALRMSPGASAGVVALFGLFHGHAHGAEMGSAGILAYALGFVLATGMLHGSGVLAGGFLLRQMQGVLRGLGAVTALAGVMIAFGLA